MSLDGFLIYFQQFLSGLGKIKTFGHRAADGCFVKLFIVFVELLHLLAQCLYIARTDQITAFRRNDVFGTTTNGTYGRQSGSHGFDEDDAERLRIGSQHECIATSQQVGYLFARKSSGQTDLPFQMQPVDLLSQVVFFLAVTGNDK